MLHTHTEQRPLQSDLEQGFWSYEEAWVAACDAFSIGYCSNRITEQSELEMTHKDDQVPLLSEWPYRDLVCDLARAML